MRKRGIQACGARLRGILRKHRKKQNFPNARGAKFVDYARNRRVAVSHCRANDHLAAERISKLLCDVAAVHDERRTAIGPDALIALGRLGRPRSQNNAVQNGHPLPAGQFDDSRIGEKLRQIATNGVGLGRIGRTRIDEKHRRVGHRAIVFERRRRH